MSGSICEPQTEVVLPLAPLRPTEHRWRRAHLVGVCGSGMQGLARLLWDWGWELSGSDARPPTPAIAALIEAGFKFYHPQAATPWSDRADLLIYSPAIGADHPERMAARRNGIVECSYPQMLGRIMRDRRGVSIAGTHGKSTTTAMTASILRDAGRQPSAIFGSELIEGGVSSWSGTGDLFVVESCEFARGFWELSPRYAAILSVEPDHFDCFATTAELVDAFAGFAARVDRAGLLLARHDDPLAMEASRACPAEVLTFGWSEEADWWAGDLRRTAVGTRFRLFRRGQYITEVQLSVPGRHNVLNAVAAAALASELGVSAAAIRGSLQEFAGIRRRFERLGSWRGVTLVDDYAHHPTAVEAALQTAREMYGRRRLVCAFQPHQVSRTRALLAEFARSFRLADRVWVVPVFAAREQVTNEPDELARRLTDQIAQEGPSAEFASSLDQLVRALEDGLRPGDVLLTLGAGDVDRVHHAFTRRILRNSAAGRTVGPVHVVEGGRARPVLPHSA
jgi:UDP-N-acetylmuramate--alanine ligase